MPAVSVYSADVAVSAPAPGVSAVIAPNVGELVKLNAVVPSPFVTDFLILSFGATGAGVHVAV